MKNTSALRCYLVLSMLPFGSAPKMLKGFFEAVQISWGQVEAML